MPTWFKIDRWSTTIKAVEVTKETACYVTVTVDRWGSPCERREAKGGDYFPTFAEARQVLMSYHNVKCIALKEEAERHHQKWLKLFSQEAPDVTA